MVQSCRKCWHNSTHTHNVLSSVPYLTVLHKFVSTVFCPKEWHSTCCITKKIVPYWRLKYYKVTLCKYFSKYKLSHIGKYHQIPQYLMWLRNRVNMWYQNVFSKSPLICSRDCKLIINMKIHEGRYRNFCLVCCMLTGWGPFSTGYEEKFLVGLCAQRQNMRSFTVNVLSQVLPAACVLRNYN